MTQAVENARRPSIILLFYALFALTPAILSTQYNVPPCAAACIENAARASRCQEIQDVTCICSFGQSILRELQDCIDNICVDQMEGINLSEYLNNSCRNESNPDPATNIVPSPAPTFAGHSRRSPTSILPESMSPGSSAPPTTSPSLSDQSSGGSPTVVVDSAVENTDGGRSYAVDSSDADKKGTNWSKVGKLIGGILGGALAVTTGFSICYCCNSGN